MSRIAAAATVVLTLTLVSAAGALPPPPDYEIEVVVVLRQQASLPPLPPGRSARLTAVVRSLRAAAAGAQRPILDVLTRQQAQGRVTSITPLWIFNGIVVTAQPEVVSELASRSDVLEVRPSETIEASKALAARTSGAPPEANVSLVNAPALWELGYRGQGTVVASMDTGVDGTHPDLAASWRGGANSWYDPNGEHPTTPTDVNGHGTWTMGAMVGGEAGGTAIGVAPAAKWIAVKIFNDQGTATTARIHQGFQWLLDPDGDPGTPDAPDVVNNSWALGAIGCNLEFQLDLHSLRTAGILPVFAAGNGGPAPDTSYSPANNPDAFAVGASDDGDVLSSMSSRGPSSCDGTVYPELVAPGVDVRTTDLYGLYAQETGTSMAAPHATAALALLLSAFPDLTPERQESALEQGAVDLGTAGPDNGFGYGRLDVRAAYDWLAAAPDFTISVSPTSVNTPAGGTAAYTATVGGINGFAGDVALSLSGLSPAQATWSFTPATIAGGAGTSQLSITASSSLAAGSYPVTITGTSGTLTHQVAATLVVTAPADFTLTATPASATAPAGGTASYTVTIGAVNGFAGNVALSLSGLTPAQGSWTFTPSTISGAGTSQLSVTTASSPTSATYKLTIKGSSGSTSHTALVKLVVKPDFALSVTPPSATVVRGQSATYTVTVAPLGGFTGSVSFSVTGLPSGASASFAPNPVPGQGSSTLTVQTAASTPKVTRMLKIKGKSGTLARQVTATLVVT